MPLEFESPEERLSQVKKANIALLGPYGVGKTHAARTLPPDTTLFVDGEAGTLALGDWPGTILRIREQATKLGAHPWEICRAIACLLAGPDPMGAADSPYSKGMYERYCELILDPALLERFTTIFVDSITVASRWSFDWAQRQPEALAKDGSPDVRGAYGLHGREMVAWLTQLQHQDKNIIVSCILDKKTDDFGRTVNDPQIVGSMAGREMPGIFDIVLTLENFETEDGKKYRAFVTQQDNEHGYPAKDRSGLLAPLEEPDLGKLISKIQGQ